MRRAITICLLLGGLVSAESASAQRSNHEGLITGLSLGAMGVGVADDASAVYYNPAGLSQNSGHSFSLSANAYGGSFFSADGVLRARDATVSKEGSSFGAFPSATIYVFGLGGRFRHAVGLSAVFPLLEPYQLSQQVRAADGSASAALINNATERVVLVGPSYSLRLGPLSFGATLYLQRATLSFSRVLATSVTDAQGQAQSINQSRNVTATHYGLTGILGVLIHWTESFSTGLRLRLPNYQLTSSGTQDYILTEISAERSHQIAEVDVPVRLRYPQPLGISVATGYRARRLKIALGLSVNLGQKPYALIAGDPLEGQEGQEGQGDRDVSVRVPKSRLTFNGMISAELFFSDTISVVTGAQTDMSAFGSGVDFDVDGFATLNYIDLFASVRIRSGSSTTILGLQTRLGRGEVGSIPWLGAEATSGSVTRTTSILTVGFTTGI